MAQEKIFHIRGESGIGDYKPIPLRIILPHERQALLNHGVSLLKLDIERGGLTPREAVCVLNGVETDKRLFHYLTLEEANKELRAVVKERYSRLMYEEERKKIYMPCSHPERPKDISNGIRKCGKCRGLVAIPGASYL